MSKINRKFFFDHVRSSLFSKALAQKQVEGMTAILDEWEANQAKKDDRWLAYMLATVYHETDKKFQGINEYGPDSYFKKYDGRKDLGNTEPGDGLRFKGRGFVQITGRTNYTKFSKILGVDLVKNPLLALELENCVKIMFYGMINGTFTGKKLSDYFSATQEDWVNARRIINRLDKANLIADEARNFYAAISYTQ
jgi:putative chitinase